MKLQDFTALSENDFDLLFEALERTPAPTGAPHFLDGMMGQLFDRSVSKDAFEAELRKTEEKLKAEKKERTENVRMLQSKLLLIKRDMKAQGMFDKSASADEPGKA